MSERRGKVGSDGRRMGLWSVLSKPMFFKRRAVRAVEVEPRRLSAARVRFHRIKRANLSELTRVVWVGAAVLIVGGAGVIPGFACFAMWRIGAFDPLLWWVKDPQLLNVMVFNGVFVYVLTTGSLLAALAWPRIARWWYDRRAHAQTADELVKWKRQKRDVVIMSWIGVVGVILGLALYAGDPAFAVVLMVFPGALLAGAVCVVLGLAGRRGARLVCGACDYPMRSWRMAGTRCPECGNRWKAGDGWNARLGVRRRMWRWLLGGLALIGTVVGTMVVVM